MKRQVVTDVACIRDVGYYRRPIRDFDIVDPITQCNEFFECTDSGRTFRKFCGRSQRFNVFTGQCDYRRMVNESNCATTSSKRCFVRRALLAYLIVHHFVCVSDVYAVALLSDCLVACVHVCLSVCLPVCQSDFSLCDRLTKKIRR